jgi:PAS domain S-box-containing protein
MNPSRTQSKGNPTLEELQRRNADLQEQLDESRETLQAIREGTVDAFLVGERVYTLEGADRPYRLFVEEMQQAVATLSKDGTIGYCNRQFADLLSIPHERVVGMNLSEVVAAEDLEACRQMSGKGEVRMRRADGKLVPVIFAFNTILEEADTSVGLLITDLTAQKHSEELAAAYQALRESEEESRRRGDQLAVFLETAAIGLHRSGPDGTILWVNDAELNMLGYSREAYVGHHIAEFHVNRGLIDDVLERLHRGERLHNIETEMICRDGSVKTVVIDSSVLWENGKFIHTQCFTRDISARKALEISLAEHAAELAHALDERKKLDEEREQLLLSERAARTEAERSTRMKEEFLSLVSHELRTPLNAILGWAQLMKRSGEKDLHRQGLEAIERGAKGQALLIDELLDVSRIVSGKLRIEVQTLELGPLVEAAAETLRPAAEAKSIHVQQLISPDAVPVKGDPARIQQVVWNLLSNAIKFTPKGGIVQILVTRKDAFVEITVVDTGMGIPAKFLPHVFERFLQADSSMARTHGGLGLGLAIVKHLVELHGGTAEVESEGEGKGATFRVRLPAVPSESSGESDGCEELGLGHLPNIKVLVVDDDPNSCEIVRRILTGCHAQVSTAQSVDEAMPLLGLFRPDVLISDIGMPGKDGLAFIRELREQETTAKSPRLPAVALTAFARPEDRVRVLEAGYNSHVSKPIDPRELVSVVESLAARK